MCRIALYSCGRLLSSSSLLGQENLIATYIAGGAWASFGSMCFSYMKMSGIPSLGASGSVLVLFWTVAFIDRDAPFSFIFLRDCDAPSSFVNREPRSITWMKAMVAFETIGLFFRYPLLPLMDHGAHLAAIGVAYGLTVHGGYQALGEYQHKASKMPSTLEITMLRLVEARRLTNLPSHRATDVLEMFAKFAEADGTISVHSFTICCSELLRSAGHNNEDMQQAGNMLRGLFDAFDSNGDGVVDFTDLATGLSVLCGGSREEKAVALRAQFDFYNDNGDGVISLKEMTRCLTPAVKVLYELHWGLQDAMGGVPPDKVANRMGKLAFAHHQHATDHSEVMTWEEFLSLETLLPTTTSFFTPGSTLESFLKTRGFCSKLI